MKMKFKENLIDIMMGAAVHCDTEEKAKSLLKNLGEHGVRWCSGDGVLFLHYWEVYGSKTCYALDDDDGFSELSYSNYDLLKEEDYKIIEFEELLENEQEDDNNDNDNLAIKVNGIIHDLIDYADKECEKTIHTAEAYRDGYIKGCKDSLGEVRAILSEFNNK